MALSPSKERIFQRHYDFLVDRMSPEFGLVDKLYSNGTLSKRQKNEIEAASVTEARNEILIKHVVQNSAYTKLFEALKECGQLHLVQFMEADGVYRPKFGGNWPLMEKENTVLLQIYETLIDTLDSRELVGRICQTEILNSKQVNLVNSKVTNEEQNRIFLEFLRIGSLDFYWQTIRCLQESNQSHIAKLFESGGVYKSEFGGNWPLMEKERAVLLKNYENLIDLLDISALIGLLYQTGVLNKRQKEKVSSKSTTAGQNKVLLEILRKGSLDGYWQMIRCLHASNQSHIAKIFETGGVVVRIDANLRTEPQNLTEVENSLATEITCLLRNTPHSEASRILEKVQLDLVGAAAKHSVSLYFLCSHNGDIDRLEQMTSIGQLKEAVEEFFNLLMKFPTRIKVTLKWSEHLFSKTRNRIKASPVKYVNTEPRKTTILCLPLQLLDTILQRVYLQLCYRVQSGAVGGGKDFNIIEFLAAVDAPWFQRILRKRFKDTIWSQLERINGKEFELYLSFRCLQCYLEEATQVGKVRLTRQDLLAADLLTGLQNARLLVKSIRKDKRRRRPGMSAFMVEKILTDRRGRDEEATYYDFISCLRLNGQTNEARVFEEEGTAAKVEIRRPRNSTTDAWSRKFSSRLNNLKERNQWKSDDQEKVIQQLKVSAIEILNSFVDRDVIVWIWCKSQTAVDTIKELYESQTLIDHLHRLADENDRTMGSNSIHLEEFSLLKIHTISLRNLVINVEGELRIKEIYEETIGVTKLRNKIFVLGRSWPSLLYVVNVFDDQQPFVLQRKLTFKEFKNATDISSFEKNFCLYIADTSAKCIWKIRPPDKHKIDGEYTCTALICPEFSGLNDFRMTVTNEGQFLGIGNRDPILLFCRSESALSCLIRIDFSEVINRPEQVAENSKGNFIFLHRNLKGYSSGGWKDQWVLSEVDQHSKTIIRQCLATGDQWLKPGGKAFLLVDPKDRIFLADTDNHRLICLDSSLRYVRSFSLDTDGKDGEKDLLTPRSMFYDGGKDQLIVVGETKGSCRWKPSETQAPM